MSSLTVGGSILTLLIFREWHDWPFLHFFWEFSNIHCPLLVFFQVTNSPALALLQNTSTSCRVDPKIILFPFFTSFKQLTLICLVVRDKNIKVIKTRCVLLVLCIYTSFILFTHTVSFSINLLWKNITRHLSQEKKRAHVPLMKDKTQWNSHSYGWAPSVVLKNISPRITLEESVCVHSISHTHTHTHKPVWGQEHIRRSQEWKQWADYYWLT